METYDMTRNITTIQGEMVDILDKAQHQFGSRELHFKSFQFIRGYPAKRALSAMRKHGG